MVSHLFFYQLTLHHVKWFPAQNYVGLTSNPAEWVRHLILPWLTLSLISAAVYTRLSRTSMLEVLSEDYIRTARSKGISEKRVIVRHALRSALTNLKKTYQSLVDLSFPELSGLLALDGAGIRELLAKAPTPAAIARIVSKSASASCGVSTAVGSSRMSMRAS